MKTPQKRPDAWAALSPNERANICQRVYRQLKRCSDHAAAVSIACALSLELTAAALSEMERRGAVHYVEDQGSGAWYWRVTPRRA